MEIDDDYVDDLVDKAPPPGEEPEALGPEEEPEADNAAAASALDDFASAAGVTIKDKKGALMAFRDLMRFCK